MPVLIPTPDEWARMSHHARARSLRVARAALAAIEPTSRPGAVEVAAQGAVPPVTAPALPKPVAVGRAGSSGPARVKGSTPTAPTGARIREEAMLLSASTPPDPDAALHRMALLQAIR